MDAISVYRVLQSDESEGWWEASLPDGSEAQGYTLGEFLAQAWARSPALASWAYAPMDPGAAAEVFSRPGLPGRSMRMVGAMAPTMDEAEQAAGIDTLAVDDPWARRERHRERARSVRAAAEAEAMRLGACGEDVPRWAGVLAWSEAFPARSDGRNLPAETPRPAWWPCREGARGAAWDRKARRHASNGGAWTAAAAAASIDSWGSVRRDAAWAVQVCLAALVRGAPDVAASVAAAVLATPAPWSWVGVSRSDLVEAWRSARREQQREEVASARRDAAAALTEEGLQVAIGAMIEGAADWDGAHNAVRCWLDDLWAPLEPGHIELRAGPLRVDAWEREGTYVYVARRGGDDVFAEGRVPSGTGAVAAAQVAIAVSVAVADVFGGDARPRRASEEVAG